MAKQDNSAANAENKTTPNESAGKVKALVDPIEQKAQELIEQFGVKEIFYAEKTGEWFTKRDNAALVSKLYKTFYKAE